MERQVRSKTRKAKKTKVEAHTTQRRKFEVHITHLTGKVAAVVDSLVEAPHENEVQDVIGHRTEAIVLDGVVRALTGERVQDLAHLMKGQDRGHVEGHAPDHAREAGQDPGQDPGRDPGHMMKNTGDAVIPVMTTTDGIPEGPPQSHADGRVHRHARVQGQGQSHRKLQPRIRLQKN